jgi:hypothetical protein
MSNSTLFRSKTYDRICNCDRRGFLKGAAGVIAGTAVASLLEAQPKPSTSPSAGMFDGFKISKVQTTGATINVISSGQGPPVLLLHGNPQTHVMWHKIAPRLAKEFTVVATDLRGYGDSSKPADGDNHSNYSKRSMALDQIEIMSNIHGRVYMDVARQPDGTLYGIDGETYQIDQERGLIVIDSPELGLVAVLPVGMCFVSSVKLTPEVGARLQKGDEFGFFLFGGSDIVMLFQNKKVVIDAEVGRKYLQGQRIGEIR